MPPAPDMPIIDTDTHWVEPPAPAKLKDVVPHIERNADGIDQWIVGRD